MPQGAFCIMQQTAARRKTRKKKSKTVKPRPPIEPVRMYDRRESGHVVGVGWQTIFRAHDNGHLKGYRAGSRILHSGQHLLDWLESGGKTGRTVEDVRKESKKKNKHFA